MCPHTFGQAVELHVQFVHENEPIADVRQPVSKTVQLALVVGVCR